MDSTRQELSDLRFSGRRLSQKRTLQVIECDDGLPEVADRKLVRMLTYWRSLRTDEGFPGRNAIDPLSIPELLPYILLLDVEKDDFRFRLVGEAVNRRYGGQIKGCSLTELLDGEILKETLDEHVRCLRHRAPIFTRNTVHTVDSDDMKLYQRLILPLSDKASEVQSIAGVMHFEK